MLPDVALAQQPTTAPPASQCTCRCVVLPDVALAQQPTTAPPASQCTCRCVVLPDIMTTTVLVVLLVRLNAPAGAWCSLTRCHHRRRSRRRSLNAPAGAWCSLTGPGNHPAGPNPASQCTCRCVVLPDITIITAAIVVPSQCTCRCVVLPDSATFAIISASIITSQCTCRCVVLPDLRTVATRRPPACLNAPAGAWCSLTRKNVAESCNGPVSMHLQVRGAP